MAGKYNLARDIIQDHSERMLNIKKYYPYFKLTESAFSQFGGGRYQCLDMGYILMAVLRFFIEQNNFLEKEVTYEEYGAFMHDIYRRDFQIPLDEEEEREVSEYIFDKIRNDGKPFMYTYFDPSDKKSKTVRMRIIDSRIKGDMVCYYITSDAIEFYLDTKEIKDESAISVAQALLSKMITNCNFRGGIDVIKRINSEVSKLKVRKNEVLNILSFDVFEGMRAYEEFVSTGMKWFDEEHKLFVKNMELAREAAKRIEKCAKTGEISPETASEVFCLEAELKKAITKHSELLAACTDLQIKADEIMQGAKYAKLRRNFNFKEALKMIMDRDDASLLGCVVTPLLGLNRPKRFAVNEIDKLLLAKARDTEQGEKISDQGGDDKYVYEDEVFEQRVSHNFVTLIRLLLVKLSKCQEGEGFYLRDFNLWLQDIFGESILSNGDYYAMLVHMCQKSYYDTEEVRKDTDTFFEAELKKASAGMEGIVFGLTFDDENEVRISDKAQISDIYFERL